MEVYCLPVLGAVSLGSKRQLGWFLLRAVRRMVPCLSPGFWRSAGTLLCSWLLPHPPDLCLWPHVSSRPSPCVCICVQVSSFYKDTSHIALQPTLLQRDLIVFTCFQIKPPSEVLGVRTSVYEFGGNTEQPITPSHSLWTPPPGRKRLSSLPSA